MSFIGASGVLSQNNSQLFWDNTNNRLGIGTTTPTQALSVAGNILATGTLNLLGTATSTFNGGLNLVTNSGCFAVNGTCIGAAGSGITSLNGLGGTSQTFATGTAGVDFGISSVGSVHTFNIPDASIANRGAVTIGTQIFGGTKHSQITSLRQAHLM